MAVASTSSLIYSLKAINGCKLQNCEGFSSSTSNMELGMTSSNKMQEWKFYIAFINVILYLAYSSCSQQQFHSDGYPQGITVSQSL